MTGDAGLGRSTGRLVAGLFAICACCGGPAAAQTGQPTPPGSAAAQPSLPKPLDSAVPLASPVIGGKPGASDRPGKPDGLERRDAGEEGRSRRAAAPSRRHSRRRTAARHDFAEPLERPALAGVELVAPIPVPRQPPHFTVPVPAYLPENAVTFYTTPLPPVVCRRVPRDPYAPDPHLIRETTVLCEADNP